MAREIKIVFFFSTLWWRFATIKLQNVLLRKCKDRWRYENAQMEWDKNWPRYIIERCDCSSNNRNKHKTHWQNRQNEKNCDIMKETHRLNGDECCVPQQKVSAFEMFYNLLLSVSKFHALYHSTSIVVNGFSPFEMGFKAQVYFTIFRH